MNDLRLNLTSRWYDMHTAGGKEEEYRDITPYWAVRFCKAYRPMSYFDGMTKEELVSEMIRYDAECILKSYDSVTLVKGYTKTQQTFEFISLHIGKVNPEWSDRNSNEYVFVIRKGKRIDNTTSTAKVLQLNPASAKQNEIQQESK